MSTKINAKTPKKKSPAKAKVAEDPSSRKRKKVVPKDETLCILRIRGAHGMKRTIMNTLNLLHLTRVNHATIVRSNASIRGMLQKAKDYIAFGPISTDSIKALLKKRALLMGNKPLTSDHIRHSTVYKSIDDLAKAIFDGKIKLKEVKDLKPIFRLNPPIGGYKRSIKKPINSGGVLGNVGDKINLYIKKMV